jgi:hypothetical protein
MIHAAGDHDDDDDDDGGGGGGGGGVTGFSSRINADVVMQRFGNDGGGGGGGGGGGNGGGGYVDRAKVCEAAAAALQPLCALFRLLASAAHSAAVYDTPAALKALSRLPKTQVSDVYVCIFVCV